MRTRKTYRTFKTPLITFFTEIAFSHGVDVSVNPDERDKIFITPHGSNRTHALTREVLKEIEDFFEMEGIEPLGVFKFCKAYFDKLDCGSGG